jgi:hypothetical protein
MNRTNQEWLKMTKGQIALCSFVYFHTVDGNAAKAVRKANKTATPEEMTDAAKRALKQRAEALAKPVEQLAPDEKLDLGTVQFKSVKAHYQEGLGFALSRLGKDGAEGDAVWKQLPEAKQYFTTLLLIYPMTREGKHDIEAIKAGQWRILPWRFGPGTYDQIWNLNDRLRAKKMSIGDRDISLRCTDTDHQMMTVSVADAAVWRTTPDLMKTVLTTAMHYYGRLVPFREVTTDQLRKKLAIGGRRLDGDGDDFTDILDNV